MLNLKKESKATLTLASDLLKNGKLVSLKTETVYGLASDSSNKKAIDRIYKLKKRSKINPLIIHVDSIKMAKKICFFHRDAELIASKFWPGPLTMILKLKKNKLVCKNSLAGNKTIALRIPRSKTFKIIIKKLKKPIAAPSANISNYISSTSAQHVADSFGRKIDLIVDSGKCELGLESTIINLSSDFYILERIGMIDIKEIKKKTGVIINNKASQDNNTVYPGQLKKHYSPKTPIEINIKMPQKGFAFLAFGRGYDRIINDTLNLSKDGNLNEAAYNFFDYLRKLDKLNKKKILVAPIPKKGLGKVINEKLEKASFKDI